MLSQPPTTVQRKSNCCYMSQRQKKFKVHVSGSSMNNYCINQPTTCQPENKEGCQKQELICINSIKWHTFICHANQKHTKKQVASLVKNREGQTAGLW